MKFDLRTPCKNCPFRTDETAIRFSCRERAEEIEESAYRRGFPCHLSAKHVEDEDSPDGESGGFEFGPDTQHCVGALIMHLHDDTGNVPFSWLPDDEQDAIRDRLDFKAPVFEGPDAFLDSYNPPKKKGRLK